MKTRTIIGGGLLLAATILTIAYHRFSGGDASNNNVDIDKFNRRYARHCHSTSN